MLHWSWKDKMGEMVLIPNDPKQTQFKVNIYVGNCMAVFIYEWKDENRKTMYELFGFINDKQHFDNCIKQYNGNLFNFNKIKSVKLNLYYSSSERLMKLLVKAGYNVSAYYKGPKKQQ